MQPPLKYILKFKMKKKIKQICSKLEKASFEEGKALMTVMCKLLKTTLKI